MRYHAFRGAASVPALLVAMIPLVSEGAPPTSLSLRDALTLTRQSNAAIRAAGELAASMGARAGDAGRRTNPTLALTHENFGGGLGNGRAETGLSITQPLGWGGARGAARGRGRAEAAVARAAAAVIEREELARTAELFLDGWAIQEKLIHLRQAEAVAGLAVEAATERARAGAGAPHERLRAETALAIRSLERRKLETAAENARRRLASRWGAALSPPDTLRLPESVPPAPPPLDSLLANLDLHPSKERARAEEAAASWRIREASALTSLDIGVEFGVKRLEEAGATGFTAGLTTSLPILNRHRGSKLGARSELRAAEATSEATSAGLRAEVIAARRTLEAALAAWDEARSRVGPVAREALRLVTAGFRAGRLGYLELLDGERSVLEANLLLVEQHAEAWRAATQLELLVGAERDVTTLNPEESR